MSDPISADDFIDFMNMFTIELFAAIYPDLPKADAKLEKFASGLMTMSDDIDDERLRGLFKLLVARLVATEAS
ncbi:hypothetical protein ABLE93_14835 [Xanthobacter sp. KR7-65]|uniref:hypothetical protein n=1 Tax=Xanthobacter sp. KR7-65 TaxID=3156612 RepID=UPI0032B43236